MGIVNNRSGTRAVQYDEKKEAILLRSHDEERKKLLGKKEIMDGTAPGSRKQGRLMMD